MFGIRSQKKNTKLYTILEVFCLLDDDLQLAMMSAQIQNNLCIHSLLTICYLIQII